jgi:hypothetical protein
MQSRNAERFVIPMRFGQSVWTKIDKDFKGFTKTALSWLILRNLSQSLPQSNLRSEVKPKQRYRRYEEADGHGEKCVLLRVGRGCDPSGVGALWMALPAVSHEYMLNRRLMNCDPFGIKSIRSAVVLRGLGLVGVGWCYVGACKTRLEFGSSRGTRCGVVVLAELFLEPEGGVVLHLGVEAVWAGVEDAAVVFGFAGVFVVGGDFFVGLFHALGGEESVVGGVLDHEWGGGAAGEDVGPVGVAGEFGGGVEHPGVGDDIVVVEAGVAAHHADDDGGFDLVAEGLEQGGAEAAAGEADAAEAAGVDVGAGEEVVGGEDVFIGDDTGHGGAQDGAVFLNGVFVGDGGPGVEADVVGHAGHGAFGLECLALDAVPLGDLLEGEFAAAPGEAVVDEDGEALAGHVVGEGAAAVAFGLPGGQEFGGGVWAEGDFFFAEVFEAAVVVECEEAGELAFDAGGAEVVGLGAWPEADGICDELSVDAVFGPVFFDFCVEGFGGGEV